MKTGGVSALRRSVLQVLIEERLQHVAAELQRRVAVPLQRAEIEAVVVDLAVPPRPHHQVVVIVACPWALSAR